MNQLNIGAALKRLRTQERHLTLHELAEAIGDKINPTTLSRMESKNQTITPEYLQILADFYGITVSAIIIEAEGGAPADPVLTHARRAPIISWQEVNQWQNKELRQKIAEHKAHAVSLPPCSDETFVLQVVGDSMQSPAGDSFTEGNFIFVDPLHPETDRNYVVAILPGNIPTFRQLVKEGAETYLKPLNRDYRPQLKSDDTKIVGTVVRCMWNIDQQN